MRVPRLRPRLRPLPKPRIPPRRATARPSTSTNCSSCHQTNGEGVSGAFPPLAGNPVVTGSPVTVIAIVKNGLEGKIVVHGNAYSGIMPAWKKQISDQQIAEVISYIRSAWNNNSGGVSLSQVQGVH